ncbi:MAG: glucodextranase DOMON-like domain-containing protein, partial [Candidatus Poseidoniaceae archaeon]
GNQILSFPSKYMVAFDFDTLRDDGRAKWNLFTAKGKTGDQEQWVLSGSSALGGCAVQDVYEFVIPWSEIGLAPRYSTRIKVVAALADSLAYGDGEDKEMAPPAPAEVVLPDLEEWVTLLELDDAIGDETGDGDYIYPLASDFATPNNGGLWDARKLTIRQSAWNAQFILEMDEMTDIWGLSNGFSHQIVQIYVDQGVTTYGSTEMLDGANARIDNAWAWEVAISGTGEPGAVFAVQSETGSTSSRGIDVSGDIDAKTITFTVSKDVIGDDIPNYRYIIVIGSQDGFGTGKWRDVDETPSTWTLGGGSNPAADDGIDYDPNIIDMILDGTGQEQMLSSYDVDGHVYATLTGFEMPEIPQQIFGASVETVTSSSAVLTWSTTVSDVTSIQYALADQQPADETTNTFDTGLGTDHAVTLTDLEVGTSYWVFIRANDTADVVLYFNTSNVIDETAPELLNLDAEVLDDGRVRVSWYTSESATELVSIGGTTIHEDAFATKKNHEFITEAYANGDYTILVKSADASGNLNESSISVTIDLDTDNNNPSPNSPNDSTGTIDEEEQSSALSGGVVQIGILITVLVLLIAFIRVRNGEDGDDKWV